MKTCFSLLAALLLTVAIGCNEPATENPAPADSSPATENANSDGENETAAKTDGDETELVDVTLKLPGVS